MKSIMILFILSIFCAVAYPQACENLFTLAWGNGQNEIGLNSLALGNQSHEKGYFALNFGPESIAVWQHKEIFILDKVHGRILVFNTQGKLLDTLSAPESATGLSVGDDGTLAAFSPFEKTVVGIRGKISGKTFQAPESFGALSEVWFVGEEIWGRYGVESARLDSAETRSTTAVARASCVDSNKVEVAISNSRNSVILNVEGTICNVFASGKVFDGNRVALTLVRPGSNEERKQEIVLCDQTGNGSAPLFLTTPWTQCFSSYTITSDGKVYEMVIRKSDITIRRWNCPKLGSTIGTSMEIALSKTSPKVPTIVGEERTTVNVWFRSSNVVKTLDLDTYLYGVVSQEIYSSWHLQAHKSMAVGARTYAMARYRHSDKNAHVCDTTCCQAWTSNPNSKAIQAVNETSGEYVMKSGSKISEPLYFSHCNGHTRNSENYDSWNYIAYLRSQPCACGYTSYYGHGVGMCQYGMQAYALQGSSYVQIIQHYYAGCTVGK